MSYLRELLERQGHGGILRARRKDGVDGPDVGPGAPAVSAAPTPPPMLTGEAAAPSASPVGLQKQPGGWERVGGGALQGAALGAATGSPWGALAGAGVGALMGHMNKPKQPAARVDPSMLEADVTNAPAMPGAGGKKFLGFFGEGGTLRRPGEFAVVGDDGPEVVEMTEQDAQVVPLGGGLSRLLQRSFPDGINPAAGAVAGQDTAAAPPALRPRRVDPAPTPEPAPATLAADEQAPGGPPHMPGHTSGLQRRLERVGFGGQPPAGTPAAAPEPAASPSAAPAAGPAPAAPPQDAGLARLLRNRAAVEARDVEDDNNGRWRSTALGAIHGAMQGLAATGDWRGALGGAASGAVGHAVRPELDEQRAQREDLAVLDPKIDRAQKLEEQALELEDRRSQIGLRDSQRKWYDARPDLERDKEDGRQLQRERQGVLAQLRLLKGSKITGEHPVLQRAAALGIFISPDDLNNTASNLVPVELVDPARPETKRRAFFNKTTGEVVADLGVSNYIAPRGADGRTANEVAADEDRDRAFEALERHRASALEITRGNFKRQLTSDLNSHQKRIFDVATEGLAAEARRLEGEIERWHKSSAESKVMPAEATRNIQSLGEQLQAIRSEMEAARARALEGMGAEPSPAPPARGQRSRAAGGRVGAAIGGGRTYTEAEARARARVRGLDAEREEEYIRQARRRGLLRP